MRSKNNIARQSSSPLTSNIIFIAHQSESCVINDIKRSVIILVARAGTNFQHLVPEKKWNFRLRTMREGRNTNSLPDQWVAGLPTPTRAVCASRIWPIRWGKGLPISNIFFPGKNWFLGDGRKKCLKKISGKYVGPRLSWWDRTSTKHEVKRPGSF